MDKTNVYEVDVAENHSVVFLNKKLEGEENA